MFYDPSPFNWSRYTILIAEDDVSSTFYLKEILKDTGVEIIHVANGLQALDICKSDASISLVLMDIKMPVMNGYDATREIKKLLPDLPVIAQTADATQFHRSECLEAGCDDFICKPIDAADLLFMISSYLKD
jgi:CheY-like chemotaxis protein